IVPQGGNTGLVGGQLPYDGEILLSLNRLDDIRDVDPLSNTITCEAGVTLGRAREAAAAVDRLYPQLLPSEGTCTIGGNLATNAGGTAAIAHGIARAHALGVEVVLADGRVLNDLNKLKKDNTGYDLKNLFIGAACLVRADGAVVAAARGPARTARSRSGRGHGARPCARRHDRRELGTGQSVLARARNVRRGAALRWRLDQA